MTQPAQFPLAVSQPTQVQVLTSDGVIPAFTTGGGPQSNVRGLDADLNSMIWGDPSQDEWQGKPNNLFFRPVPGSPDGFSDNEFLNDISAGGGGVAIFANFGTPATVTSVVGELDAQLPPGVGASTVVLQIRDVTGVTTLATVSCVLTAQQQTFSTPAVATVFGTQLRLYLLLQGTGGSSANASVQVGRLRVRPVAAAAGSLFAGQFVRYNASSKYLWDNHRIGLISPGGGGVFPQRHQATNARFCFWTDASTIGVLVANSIFNVSYHGGNVGIYVNGAQYQAPTPTPTVNTFDVIQVNLPAGYNYVEVENSDGSGTTPLSIGVNTVAVFAPKGAAFQVVAPRQDIAQRRICWVCDSKGVGYGATAPVFGGILALLRRAMPDCSFVVEGRSGVSVFSDNSTAVNQQALIARLAQTRSNVFVFYGYHRNDWQGQGAAALQSPAAMQTQLEQLVDALHAACPTAQMIFVSSSSETAEGANLSGFTLPQYRTAGTTNIVNPRADWCTFVDGTSTGVPGFNPATDTFDGVHPNDNGYSKIATAFLQSATLWDNPVPQAAQLTVPVEHYAAAVASAGTFAPTINVPNNNEGNVLRVTIMAQDTVAHTSAALVHYVKANNAGGAVTAGAVTVAFSDIASFTITAAYSVAAGGIVVTVTNSSANPSNIKVRTEVVKNV